MVAEEILQMLDIDISDKMFDRTKHYFPLCWTIFYLFVPYMKPGGAKTHFVCVAEAAADAISLHSEWILAMCVEEL